VIAIRFKGYWQDIATIQACWRANLGLLNEPPGFDLYDTDWEIHTGCEERPPARLTERASVTSVSAPTAASSTGLCYAPCSHLLFTWVRAQWYAIRSSLRSWIVGLRMTAKRAALDKHVVIGHDSAVGRGEDPAVNRRESQKLSTDITIIGKGARVASGLRGGRNVKIGSDALERDFAAAFCDGRLTPCGETVELGAG